MANKQRVLPGLSTRPRNPMQEWTLKDPRGWKFPRNFRKALPPVRTSPWQQFDMFHIFDEPMDLVRQPPRPPDIEIDLDAGKPNTIPPTGNAPKMLTSGKPSLATRAKGLLGKFGKGLGIAGVAMTAGQIGKDLLDHYYPDRKQWSTEEVYGLDLLDKKPKDVHLPTEIKETPPLSPFEELAGPGDVNLPPEGPKASRLKSPKKSGGFAGALKKRMPAPSLSLEPLSELPGETVINAEPLEELGPERLTSQELPDMIKLGGNEPSTAIKNDSLNPDRQQSAFDRYFSLANDMPQMEDFAPNVWQRIAAAMAGASQGWFGGAGSGLETSMGFLRQPYNEAVSNWKAQLDELEPLMEMESRVAMNDAKIKEQARKTDLINQTKTVENEIKRLATEGKIANDADRNRILMRTAEIRQDIANGQMELAQAKLDELREYHQGILADRTRRTSITASEAASRNAKRQQEIEQNATGVGKKAPSNDASYYAATESNVITELMRDLNLSAQDIETYIYPQRSNVIENADEEYWTRRREVLSEFNRRMYRSLKARGLTPENYGIRGGS